MNKMISTLALLISICLLSTNISARIIFRHNLGEYCQLANCGNNSHHLTYPEHNLSRQEILEKIMQLQGEFHSLSLEDQAKYVEEYNLRHQKLLRLLQSVRIY